MAWKDILEALTLAWETSPINQLFFFAFAFVWGSCWGSFVQASAHRMPRGISLLYPGSRCPKCLHSLGLLENLPLIGWLSLKGRCSACREPIALRYLWVEMLTGVLHLPAMALAMESPNPLAFFVLASVTLSWALLLSLIDGEHRYLPDLLTLGPLFVLIVVQTNWNGSMFQQPLLDFFILSLLLLLPQLVLDLARSLLGTLFGTRVEERFDQLFKSLLHEDGRVRAYGVPILLLPFLPLLIWFYPELDHPRQVQPWLGLGIALGLLLGAERFSWLVLKKPGLGLGDVKLGALLGWVLGWTGFLLALGLACSTALSIAILKGAHRRKDADLPFGPFMAWSGVLIYLLQIHVPDLF